MYLSRGFLNLTSRDVLRDLASPLEMHRSLMRGLPDELGDAPRREGGLLYRIDHGKDGGALLVATSKLRPNFAALPRSYFLDGDDDRLFSLGWSQHPLVEPMANAHPEGTRCAFRIAANTTRKVETKTGDDGKRRNGKRVPLRGDSERLDWLARKATQHGFRVLDVRVEEDKASRRGRQERGPTFAGSRFDGLLEVSNAELFRVALETGVGPAKAYGFGLLSVRPV